MRNLKKILALVLALMMVMSMMVTASATTFVDDADIDAKYAEAVTVLSGIGVIRGNPYGEEGEFAFNPKGELTRAQAATIVSYVLEGTLDTIADLVELIENPFTDVPEWAVPYVLYANSQGIIIGRNATTYDPNGTITGYELGKMLLIAGSVVNDATGLPFDNTDFLVEVYVVDGKGYADYEDALVASVNAGGAAITTKAVAVGDWQLTVATALKSAKIWDSEFKLSKKLTREEACFLTFNTMNTANARGEKLMDDFKVTATEKTVDALGRPLENLWTDAKGNVIYSESPACVVAYTAKTSDATIKADLGVTKLPGGSNPTDNGKLVEYYVDAVATDGTVTYKYVAINYTAASLGIAKADKDGNVAYTLNGTKYYDYSATYAASKKVTDTVALHGEVADKATVTYVKDSKGVAHIYPTTTVAGTLSAKSSVNGTLTIDGTKYTKSVATGALAITNAAYALGEISVQLDQFGFVVGATYVAPVETTETLVYVVDHYYTFAKGTAAVYDKYGNEVTEAVPNCHYIIAQVVGLDGAAAEYVVGGVLGQAEDFIPNLAAYATNEGKILAIEYNKTTKVHEFKAPTAGTVVSAASINKDAVSFTIGANKYYYNNAEFVYIQGSLDKLAVSAGSLKGADEANNAVAIISNADAETTNKVVSKIFYFNATAPVVNPEYSTAIWATGAEALEESSVLKKDATVATPIYTHAVYINGEAAVINTYVEVLPVGFYSFCADEYDVYNLVPLTGVIARIDNVYGSYITFEDLKGTAWDKADFDVTGIPVINLSKGNKTLDKGDYVVFYAELNEDEEYEIACFYLVDGGSYVVATGAGWTLYADGNYKVTTTAGFDYAFKNVGEDATITIAEGTYGRIDANFLGETASVTGLTIVGEGDCVIAGMNFYYCDIEDLTISGIEFTGLIGFGSTTLRGEPEYNEITIQNCVFTGVQGINAEGILVTDITIKNCEFDTANNSIVLTNVDGLTITGCEFVSGYNAVQCGASLTGDVVIKNNEFETVSRVLNLVGLDSEADVTIEGNYFSNPSELKADGNYIKAGVAIEIGENEYEVEVTEANAALYFTNVD